VFVVGLDLEMAFVSRSRACRLRRLGTNPLSTDESRQTFVG
jgi:hypothetical protein